MDGVPRQDGKPGRTARKERRQLLPAFVGRRIAPQVGNSVAKQEFAGSQRRRVVLPAQDVKPFVAAFQKQPSAEKQGGHPLLADGGLDEPEAADLPDIEANHFAVDDRTGLGERRAPGQHSNVTRKAPGPMNCEFALASSGAVENGDLP
jgi:hypothetical protein